MFVSVLRQLHDCGAVRALHSGLKVWNVYPPLYWPGLDWYDWSETVLVAVWEREG